ncbi:MAG: hypothetical protein BWZ10_03381 [candidate division BRC1 bacterium ADurb.BinA364]|nr:MAG: hypothetical protein BWZ10_03381 [candidate division BRC1 bacterium ADurb.BinA364]
MRPLKAEPCAACRPCSPDFNPIEMMWAKVQAVPRAAKARALKLLADSIAQDLSQIVAKEAQSFFVAAL